MSFPRPEGFDPNSKLQRNLDWLAAGRVVGFIGGDISEQDDGVLLTAEQGTAGSGDYPFRVTSFLDSGTRKLRVSPGICSLLLPTNVTATFAVSAGTSYMLLDATTNGRNVTSCVLNLSTSPPAAVAPASGTAPSAFSVCLALVTYVVGPPEVVSIYQTQFYNIVAVPQVAFTQSIVPASPGEEPFIRWYGWGVTSV